jgi:zinc transport system substrate-binding protein
MTARSSWPHGVALSLVLGVTGLRAAAAEAPQVVASIKPIHSLVAGVMEGIGEPEYLVVGAGSEHGYSLRPSQAAALSQARVVFWVGENLETFLVKPLEALSGDAAVVALSTVDGLHMLPTREGGMWDEHADEHEDEHADGDGHGDHDGHGGFDMHVWLDPDNAEAMVDAIATALSAADPEHAADYQANAAKVHDQLAALDLDLRERLAPIGDRPFVVFHDAYHYVEDRYGLNAVGSIMVDPQRRPSAGRLGEIRAKLEELDAACVFAEPQFEPALVDTVIEGTSAKKGVLDPLGAGLEAGPQQYFQLMTGLADSLVTCLGRQRSG